MWSTGLVLGIIGSYFVIDADTTSVSIEPEDNRIYILPDDDIVLSMDDVFPEYNEYTIRGIVGAADVSELVAGRESESREVISRWHQTADTINRFVGQSRTASAGWRISFVPDVRATSWTERDTVLHREYHVEDNVSKRSSGNSVYYAWASLETSATFPGPPVRFSDKTKRWWNGLKRSVLGPSRRVFISELDMVVKYDNTCRRIYRQEHPWRDTLFSEYIIMRAIEPLGISPRAVALSRATFPTLQEWKFDPRINISDKPGFEKFCIEHRAHVRALVMERAGMDLGDFRHLYADGTVTYFLSTLRIGEKMIELLETLHDAGFVHGDIHASNVAFRRLGDESTDNLDLILLDFGMSRFFPSEYGKDFHPFHPSVSVDHLDPTLLSSWQFYDLSRTGRRDDIYRAVELVLSIMTPNDEFRAYLSLDERKHEVGRLRARKSWVNFFTHKSLWTGSEFRSVCDVFARSITMSVCRDAMEHLDNALDNVRSIFHPDERPDYARIKQYFQDAHDVVTITMNSSTQDGSVGTGQ
jgi:hypothetical protein